MKYNIFAIAIGLIAVYLEIQVNLKLYEAFSVYLESTKGDASPSLFAGGFTLLFPVAVIHLIGLTVSMIAVVKKQKYSRIGLWLNIFGFILITIFPTWHFFFTYN